MPTPFPGMDPYLEWPDLWSSVHSRLIVATADVLVSELLPKYYVTVEERSYGQDLSSLAFSTAPDVAILNLVKPEAVPPQARSKTAMMDAATVEPVVVTVPTSIEIIERYLEVRAVESDRVVTALEILSPWNKAAGTGQTQYLRKRGRVLDSGTHLVEVDLLRGGQTMPALGYDQVSHYRILISRAEQRPEAHLLSFTIQQLIPAFALPLEAGDREPLLDLNKLFHEIYERARYDLRLNYSQEPVPPFEHDDDREWADRLLTSASLR